MPYQSQWEQLPERVRELQPERMLPWNRARTDADGSSVGLHRESGVQQKLRRTAVWVSDGSFSAEWEKRVLFPRCLP